MPEEDLQLVEQAAISTEIPPSPPQPQVSVPQTQKKRGRPWLKRIVLALGVLVIMGGLLVWQFPQVWMVPFLKVRYSKEKHPEVYQFPVLREVKPPEGNLSEFPEFSYSNYKFKVPWDEVPERKEAGDGTAILKFVQNYKTLMLHNEQPPLDILGSFLSGAENLEQVQKLRILFGEESLSSSYNFYKLILESSPDQITLTSSVDEVVVKGVLIPLKSVLALILPGGIYEFAVGDLRGFQYGDPALNNVSIFFFDLQDQIHNITLFEANQEEIDFILSTIEIL